MSRALKRGFPRFYCLSFSRHIGLFFLLCLRTPSHYGIPHAFVFCLTCFQSTVYLHLLCQKKSSLSHHWPGLKAEAPQHFLRAGVRTFPNWQGGRGFLPALGGECHFANTLIAVCKSGDPAAVFDRAQISRQSGSLQTQFGRQLGDGERAGLRECGQDSELGCAKSASSEVPLVVLRHGAAGMAQRRACTTSARFERG